MMSPIFLICLEVQQMELNMITKYGLLFTIQEK